MNKIKILDKSVYEKIAAGECVEKPASIVKELVENSFDAGATQIYIEIENGGIDKIVVQDNGCGISKDDLNYAFIPHATSKITNAEDLYNLYTMGFRGEALSSISAVSMVEMISKTATDDVGSKIIVNGGELGKITECAASTGTYISVKNLFFNIPARAKFLRKPKQEENDITSYIEKLMLSNPEISFKYVIDGKIIYNTQNSTLLDNIYTIYGDIGGKLIEVNYKQNDFEITGYISKPDFVKNNRTYQTLFVNNRYVQNYIISNAIHNAYGDFLMKGKFPLFVLNLKIPPNIVDVNVHPNKLEVRFENSNSIYGLFNNAVYNALDKNAHQVTSADLNQSLNTNNHNIFKTNSLIECNPILNNKTAFYSNYDPSKSTLDNFFSKPINKDFFEFHDSSNNVLSAEIALEVLKEKEEHSESKTINNTEQEFISELKDEYKIIGVIFETYIIIEKNMKVYIIDQHASHERILYDKIMDEVNNNNLTIQHLLVPYILNLSTKENQFIENNLEFLKQCGFSISEFGTNSYKIDAIPYILQNIDLKKFFDSVLQDSENVLKKHTEYIKEYFTQKACKAAVKAGMKLNDLEIKTIFKQLNENNNILLCPHGRPILMSLEKKDIEKMFKRIV